MYPNQRKGLIIPTQHNVLMSYGQYAGVEVDCFASGFNQKVQILAHFKNEKLKDGHVFRSMLAHTFKYRSSQLFDFISTITKPDVKRIDEAALNTGADESLVGFVRIYVGKVEKLLDQHWDRIPPESVKNKILRNFFDTLRTTYSNMLINRAQTYLNEVKRIVKANFSLKYFYRTSEVIEEARSLGGRIVVPHPEQFWPILLTDYDVDGYEVWNPQSRRYTEFLISVVHDKNKRLGLSHGPLLVFMGDDTHMAEKVKDPEHQDKAKASREIGLQPAWDDLVLKKRLITANMDRDRVIDEYQSRLDA
jgi:hypothetical protein